MKLGHARFTAIRSLMTAIVVTAVVLAVRSEFEMRQRRQLDAILRKLEDEIREYRGEHANWGGCRGLVPIKTDRESSR